MATMRRLDSGKYQVRWRQDGREPSETFATKDGATKFKGLVDAAGQRYPEGWVPRRGFVRQPEQPSALTLREWFPRAMRARPTASAATKKDYLSMFDRHVPDWLQDTPMKDLTLEDAGGWVTEMLDRLSPKTVHNIHGLVSSVVDQAVKAGHIETDVFTGLTAGLLDHPPQRVFLERDEFELLLECFPGDYRDFVEFLYLSGMRWSEATALPFAEVDHARGVVHVRWAFKKRAGATVVGHPKTQRGNRTIPMPPGVMQKIKARDPRLLPDARLEAGEIYVFTSRAGGPIGHAAFYHGFWVPAVDAANKVGLLKRPRIHDLRHSHAALLLSAGVPLLAVSRRLGHSSVAVTGDIYGHLSKASDDAVMQALL